jgi:hypothetical protein
VIAVDRIKHLGRPALGSAAAFGLLGAILAYFEPRSAALGYRFALFACLSAPLGCLILVLLHRIVGGQWTSDIGIYLRAGAELVPWIWLLALPLLAIRLPLAKEADHALHDAYNGPELVALRAVVYAAVFFGLRWAIAGDIGRERAPIQNARPWLGPGGLILLVFMLTLLADDWLEALEPGWHSTAFTAVWMAGQVVAGLSLCLLLALGQGAVPGAIGSAERPVGRDWGNLLLAGSVFWTYLAFAQFLIIWAGNLPEEISWFLRREKGPWGFFIPAVILFGFAVPFFLLLSRRVKGSRVGLAWTAGMLLAAQMGYTAWIILPAGGHLSFRGAAAVVAIICAGGSLLINRFIHGASRARRS